MTSGGIPIALADTRGLLRLLAAGLSPPAIAARRTEGSHADISESDVRAALAGVDVLVRDTPLLSPARAGFLGRRLLPPAGAFGGSPGIDVSVEHLDELRTLAVSLLTAHATHQETDPAEPTAQPAPSMRSAALQYAEAILAQAELIDTLEHAAGDDNSLHAALDPRDRLRLRDVLLYRGRTEPLTARWTRGVDAIQRRSPCVIHETYIDGLSARDAIEEAAGVLSPVGRATLDRRVRPADERLVNATRAVASSVCPSEPWRPQPWWWYRLPRDLSQSFRERLQHVAPEVARELDETDPTGS